jgi:hypothetical protein
VALSVPVRACARALAGGRVYSTLSHVIDERTEIGPCNRLLNKLLHRCSSFRAWQPSTRWARYTSHRMPTPTPQRGGPRKLLGERHGRQGVQRTHRTFSNVNAERPDGSVPVTPALYISLQANPTPRFHYFNDIDLLWRGWGTGVDA